MSKRTGWPIQQEYVERLPEDVRRHVVARAQEYVYRAQVDIHAFIDGKFALGMECKSYTENAMLKRILVDFRLLKSCQPNLLCCLLQLESQLGGGYSTPMADPQIGSARSHTLMSYFPEVDLNVITLLEGERRVDQPIHQADHFKELHPAYLGPLDQSDWRSSNAPGLTSACWLLRRASPRS